jgi:acetoacetate decarboxylase
MKETDVRANAFAMPLASPAFPPGPYRLVNREYLIITYRTDPERLRAVVPEPLEGSRAVLRRVRVECADGPVAGGQPRLVHAVNLARKAGDRGFDRRAHVHRSRFVYRGNAAWKLSRNDGADRSVADARLFQHVLVQRGLSKPEWLAN